MLSGFAMNLFGQLCYSYVLAPGMVHEPLPFIQGSRVSEEESA